MSQATLITLREWALALPVMGLLFLPGLGPAWVFGRRRSLSAPWILLLSFAWGVAWTSLVAISAYLAQGTLTFVVWAYLATIPVSIAFLARDIVKHGRPGKLKIEPQGLGIAAAAWIVSIVQGPQWFGTPDNYYHLAASRSLIATGRPIVTDPFFGLQTRVPDATAGMWNTLQAVISKITLTDVASVYAGLTAFSAFVVVLAFWLLAREVSLSRTAASVATVVYIIASWYTDFRPFGYPNRVSIALAFTALAIMVRVATKAEWGWVLAMGVTGLSGLAVHLASGQMELLSAGGAMVSCALLSFVPLPAKERRAARFAALRLGLGILLMLAPVSPVLIGRIAAVFNSEVIGADSYGLTDGQVLSGPWGIHIVTPGGFNFGGAGLFWLTLAISAIALVYALRSGDRRTAVMLPIVLMAPLLTTLPPLSTWMLNFSSYIVGRMADIFRFAPYLAAAWGLGILRSWPRRSSVVRLARILSVLVLVVALFTAAPFVVSTYAQGKGSVRKGAIWSVPESWKRDMRKVFGFSMIFEMREIVGKTYPRVLADPDTSYHLMGLVPVTVVATLPTHTPVFLPSQDVIARNLDVQRFFEPQTTHRERAAILARWDVDYVMVRQYIVGAAASRAILDDTDLFQPLVSNGDITFLRVNRVAVDAALGGQS